MRVDSLLCQNIRTKEALNLALSALMVAVNLTFEACRC